MRARTALAIGIPSILGLILIGLAVPRTGAAWWALGSPYAFEKRTVLQLLATEEIAQGRASLEAALQWHESSQLLLELATLELSAALPLAPDDTLRSAILEHAERHLDRSLARNPANAITWHYLALVRSARGAEGHRIAEALAESLHAGPMMKVLWLPRAEMLMRYWRFLDSEGLELFRSQLRMISAASWSDERKLLEAARKLGELRLVAAALASDPSAHESFLRLKAELASAPGRASINR